jgi:hypothetical protein
MFALTPEVLAELGDECVDRCPRLYRGRRKEREYVGCIGETTSPRTLRVTRQDVKNMRSASLACTSRLCPEHALAHARHAAKDALTRTVGHSSEKPDDDDTLTTTTTFLTEKWRTRLAPLLTRYGRAGLSPVECDAKRATERRNDCFFACVAKAYDALVSASAHDGAPEDRSGVRHVARGAPSTSAQQMRAFCTEALVVADEAESWWLEERATEIDRARSRTAPQLEPPLFTRTCRIRQGPARASWYADHLRRIIGGSAYCGNTRLLKRLCDHPRAPPNLAFLVFTHQGALYPYVFAPPLLHAQLSRFLATDATPSSSSCFPPAASSSTPRPSSSPSSTRVSGSASATTGASSSATARGATAAVMRSSRLKRMQAPPADHSTASALTTRLGPPSDTKLETAALHACRYALLYHTIVTNSGDGTFDYHWQLLEDGRHSVLFAIDHPLLTFLVRQDIVDAPTSVDDTK